MKILNRSLHFEDPPLTFVGRIYHMPTHVRDHDVKWPAIGPLIASRSTLFPSFLDPFAHPGYEEMEPCRS